VAQAGSLWKLAPVRRLAGLSALGFSSFFLTLASVPSFAVRSGTSSAAAGAVTAAMLASTVLTQALVPTLERRLGTPRLLALGLLALGAPAPLYLISSRLGWLIAVSVVRGLGFAVLTVLGALLATREAPPGRNGEAIGIYGLSIAGPNLIAVPGGVALTSYGHFSWVAVLAACPVLAVPLAGGFHAAAAQAAAAQPVRHTAAARATVAPSLMLLVVTLAGGGLVTFLPIQLPRGSLASIALFLFGIAAALCRWQAGTLGDRIGARRLLPVALVAGTAGLVTVALALFDDHAGPGRALPLLVGAAVFGAGYGATQNLTLIVAFARAGPGNSVTASAIWNAAFDAGTAVGAYGVGLAAATALGLPGTYLVCAGLIALAVPAAITATSQPAR
jgi:predicted MFS family arabinose efflux permease